MAPTPDISVILPVRDGVRFVVEAVESVLAQGIAVEIIAVDDGSTDDTAERLSALPAVRILQGGTALKGIGPAAARNLALAEARAPLIGFIDHDDL